jgi:DNA-binding transcriptional MerR regulator
MTQDELFPWEVPDEPEPAAAAPAPALSEAPPTVRPRPTAPGRADVRGEDQRAMIERSTPPPGRERLVAPKEYYSISEVCEIVGLKPHVLRYWETQFPPLSPSKNRSGNRVYQRKEIKLILLVKRLLYEEKFTVEGARARLDQLRRTGRLQEMTGRALRYETVDLLRSELQQLARILTPPGSA